MKLNLLNANCRSHRDNFVFGLVVVVVIAISMYLSVMANSADKHEMGLSIVFILTPILVLYVLSSEKTWIPILICLALVRDLSLGSFVGGGGVKIGDLFIFIIFGAWFLKGFLMRSQTRFLKSPLDGMLLLFLMIHVASLLWSTDMDLGILRVLKLARNFCFFLIIRDLFINDFRGSYKQVEVCFILTSLVLLIVHMTVIISLGGVADFQSLSQQEVLNSQSMGALRSGGTGAGFLISGPSAWLTISGALVFGSLMLTKSKIVRLLKVVIIALMFGGSMLTLSRTAIINIGIIMAILFWGSIKLKLKENVSILWKMSAVVFVVGIKFGIMQIFSKRMHNMFGDRSWWEREDLYRSAIDAFLSSPLFGIGVGSNNSWQLNYDIDASRIVHSLYLTILSETGIIGFVILILVVLFWLRYLWVCMNNVDVESYMQNICLSLFAFSVAFLIYSFTVGELENFEPWLMMGIASAVKILYLPSKHSDSMARQDTLVAGGETC